MMRYLVLPLALSAGMCVWSCESPRAIDRESSWRPYVSTPGSAAGLFWTQSFRNHSALSPGAAAQEHVGDFLSFHGLAAEPRWPLSVVSVRPAAVGGHLVDLERLVAGVPVRGHGLRVFIDGRGQAVGLSGKLPLGSDAPVPDDFRLTPKAALRQVLIDFAGAGSVAIGIREGRTLSRNSGLFEVDSSSARGLEVNPRSTVRVDRVFDTDGEYLIPAYALELAGVRPKGDPVGIAYIVDAVQGEIRQRENRVSAYQYRVWVDETTGTPHPNPWGGSSWPYPTIETRGYMFEPVPSVLYEPSGGNRFADPWLPPDATDVVGNHVEIRIEDAADPSGFVPLAVLPDAKLDYPLDFGKPSDDPSALEAAATSAFYVVNYLHDLFYDHGFTELAGNAQHDNYGRGGLDGDRLVVRVMPSFAGAGALPRVDGVSPELFLGTNAPEVWVWLVPDGGAPWQLRARHATGAPQDVETALVATTFSSGCEAFADGGLADQIVAVARGFSTCTASDAAAVGENVGAAAIIYGTLSPNKSEYIGNTNDGVSSAILVAAISPADFERLEGLLAGGPVSARVVVPFSNDAVDATVVAHEWGHYVYRRLVSAWLVLGVALGEGTADFIALVALSVPADLTDPPEGLGGAFPVGAFGAFEHGRESSKAYSGFRRYPYSTDFAKNPLTFRHISLDEPLPRDVPHRPSHHNNEIHNVGELWALVLWETYVSLVDTHGYAEGRKRMLEYTITGLQLLPNGPQTFLIARDAFLQVAAEEDRDLMWRAFAKRGMGVDAVAPPAENLDNLPVQESFLYPGGSELRQLDIREGALACSADQVIDAGEYGEIHIRGTLRENAKDALLTVGSDAAKIEFPSGASIDLSHLAGGADFDVSIPFFARDVQPASTWAFFARLHDGDGQTALVRRAALNYSRVASNVEDFSYELPNWTHSGPGAVWHARETRLGEYRWRVQASGPSGALLVTPPILVGSGSQFALTYEHVHSGTGCNVVELSTDGGVSWSDVAQLTDAGYTATCAEESSDLHNAAVHTDDNPDYPAPTSVRLDFGAQLAGETVHFRFRATGNDSFRRTIWELHRVEVEGAVSPPFINHVPNPEPCMLVDGVAPAVVETNAAVTLNATVHASMGEYDIVWHQLEGPDVTLTPDAADGATFTAPSLDATAVLRFEVIATAVAPDLSVRDEVEIRVLAPLVADAGPDHETSPGALVHLDASGSFGEPGEALKYSWSRLAPPPPSPQGSPLGTNERYSFKAPLFEESTTLVYRVTVSSQQRQQTAHDDVEVRVQVATEPPVPDEPSDGGPGCAAAQPPVELLLLWGWVLSARRRRGPSGDS